MKYNVAERVINKQEEEEFLKLRKEYEQNVEDTEIIFAVMDQLIYEGIDKEIRDPDEIREDLKLVAHDLDKASRYAALMNYYRGEW